MARTMKANIVGLWLALTLFLGGTDLLRGALVAPQSIVTLEQTADLIVNGTAAGIVQNGSRFDFSLQVNRVIKGDGSVTGSSIGAYWLSGNQGTAGSGGSGDVGSTGIWFLQRTPGAWRVVPVVQGTMQLSNIYVPAPPGPVVSAYAYSAPASVDDKLASEICSAAESATSYSLQSYALLSGGIDELKSSIPQVFYRRLVNSSSAEQRILGLSGLIRSGDASALTAAAKIASMVAGRPAEGVLLLSLREHFRAIDPASVMAVGQVTTDSSIPTTLREVAAHALAAVHTAVALPFLATLLDDSDLNLRVEAVGGMGAFANGLPVQTRQTVATLAYLQFPANAPYKTQDTVAHFALGRQAIGANEASYISFWKDWWSKNRGGLGY